MEIFRPAQRLEIREGKEEKEEKEDNVPDTVWCIICRDKRPALMPLPCAHFHFCISCWNEWVVQSRREWVSNMDFEPEGNFVVRCPSCRMFALNGLCKAYLP